MYELFYEDGSRLWWGELLGEKRRYIGWKEDDVVAAAGWKERGIQIQEDSIIDIPTRPLSSSLSAYKRTGYSSLSSETFFRYYSYQELLLIKPTATTTESTSLNTGKHCSNIRKIVLKPYLLRWPAQCLLTSFYWKTDEATDPRFRDTIITFAVNLRLPRLVHHTSRMGVTQVWNWPLDHLPMPTSSLRNRNDQRTPL